MSRGHGRPQAQRAYVAFSGGGAKGVVHVGALKALEEGNFEVRGWAGTSIGALVATFAAAGFRADDIFHTENGVTIMRSISQIDRWLSRPTDFFGILRWPLILLFRTLTNHLWLLWIVVAFALVVPIPGYWIAGGGGPAMARTLITIWVILSLLFVVTVVLTINGIGSSRRLKNALRIVLQQKVFPGEPGRPVLFSDFAKDGRPGLKIVAANLTEGRLQLFSPEDTPDMDVVDAIGASISLPMVFRLPRIGTKFLKRSAGDLQGVVRASHKSAPPTRAPTHLFTDGGIVSNLPAWPFDEERGLDPEACTIAIDIPEARPSSAPDRLTWIPSFLQTGFFGSAELNLRGTNTSIYVPLQTSIGVLDFDASLEAATQAIQDARAWTEVILRNVREQPVRIARACEIFHGVAQRSIRKALYSRTAGAGRVRCSIAMPPRGTRSPKSLRLQHCHGFGTDGDASALLPIEGSIVGLVWTTGRPFLSPEPIPDALQLPGAENTHLRDRISTDLQWVYAIPIFSQRPEGPRLEFVLSLDGDSPLDRNDETDGLLNALAATASSIFEPLMTGATVGEA